MQTRAKLGLLIALGAGCVQACGGQGVEPGSLIATGTPPATASLPASPGPSGPTPGPGDTPSPSAAATTPLPVAGDPTAIPPDGANAPPAVVTPAPSTPPAGPGLASNLSPFCTYPTTTTDQDLARHYQVWKDRLLITEGAGGFLRVIRPDSPGAEVNSTVSEGIAYGMILSVLMDDPTVFDQLWQYSQLWVNQNGLMNWYIDAAGTQALGTGGATDGDEDIAWALVLASRRWGGSGSLGTPYLDLALAQIDRIWQFEIAHDQGELLLPGDGWGSAIFFNPSYFAPNQYRVFGEVSGNVAGWNQVIDTGYAVLEASLNAASGNASNGLVPAWTDAQGNPAVPFGGAPTNYQYDSARIPFRIGQDYCSSGDPRAASYLQRISDFFAGIGASNIVDGYALDGSPFPDPATPPGSPQSAVFVGSAAVGALHDARFLPFVDQAYSLVNTGTLLARSTYYNLSWTALSVAMLTGRLTDTAGQ